MTNVEEISQELDRECLGGQQVVKAMLRGMLRSSEGVSVCTDFCDAAAALAVDHDAEAEPIHDDFFHRRQQHIDETPDVDQPPLQSIGMDVKESPESESLEHRL